MVSEKQQMASQESLDEVSESSEWSNGERLGLMQQARQNMSLKMQGKPIDEQISKQFELMNNQQHSGLMYIKDALDKNPEWFDNDFRNLYSYVQVQYIKDQKSHHKKEDDQHSYFEQQQEYLKNLQDLMTQYDIKTSKRVLPFNERIERMCRMENAYLDYKKKRVDILLDKEARQQKEEPFHLKYLRKIQQEKDQIKAEKEEEQRQYDLDHKRLSTDPFGGFDGINIELEEDPFAAKIQMSAFYDPKQKGQARSNNISQQETESQFVEESMSMPQDKHGYFKKFFSPQNFSPPQQKSSNQFLSFRNSQMSTNRPEARSKRTQNYHIRNSQIQKYEAQFRPGSQQLTGREINNQISQQPSPKFINTNMTSPNNSTFDFLQQRIPQTTKGSQRAGGSRYKQNYNHFKAYNVKLQQSRRSNTPFIENTRTSEITDQLDMSLRSSVNNNQKKIAFEKMSQMGSSLQEMSSYMNKTAHDLPKQLNKDRVLNIRQRKGSFIYRSSPETRKQNNSSQLQENLQKLRAQYQKTRNNKSYCKARTVKNNDQCVQELIKKYPPNIEVKMEDWQKDDQNGQQLFQQMEQNQQVPKYLSTQPSPSAKKPHKVLQMIQKQSTVSSKDGGFPLDQKNSLKCSMKSVSTFQRTNTSPAQVSEKQISQTQMNSEKFQNSKKQMEQKVQLLKNKQKSSDIAQLCMKFEGQLQQELNEIHSSEVQMRIRQKDASNVVNFVQELDFATSSVFPLIYAFKQKDLNQQVALGHLTSEQYQIEKKDPKKILLLEYTKKALIRNNKKKREQKHAQYAVNSKKEVYS